MSSQEVRIVTKVENGTFQSWPEKGVDSIVTNNDQFHSWRPLTIFKDPEQVKIGTRFTVEEGQALVI